MEKGAKGLVFAGTVAVVLDYLYRSYKDQDKPTRRVEEHGHDEVRERKRHISDSDEDYDPQRCVKFPYSNEEHWHRISSLLDSAIFPFEDLWDVGVCFASLANVPPESLQALPALWRELSDQQRVNTMRVLDFARDIAIQVWEASKWLSSCMLISHLTSFIIFLPFRSSLCFVRSLFHFF